MGKRVVHVSESPPALSTPPARSIRRRKRNKLTPSGCLNNSSAKTTLRLSGGAAATTETNCWHENDDEDSSSNDAPMTQRAPPRRQLPPTTPVNIALARQQSTKHANNSSILLNTSLSASFDTSVIESPKPVYTLRPSLVNGTVMHDLTQKPWRLGRPIGKGNFGEIFLASDNIAVPVTNENANFVVKIEPHSNGPLFVEIHCLMNTAKKNSNNEDDKKSALTMPIPPTGIPDYIASGSHYFGDARYRFLVLKRFDRDLHSLIRHCRVNQKSVLTLAIQIVNVLEKLHDKGYCHNDVKAQNLMISKCKYQKRECVDNSINSNGDKKSTIKVKFDEQPTTDSGNSSEQEEAADYTEDADFKLKNKSKKYNDMVVEEDDEDFDDGATSHSNNSNSMDIYETPINKNSRRRQRGAVPPNVEFSGSNPVRSCRRQQRNSMYEEMVKSHYLRPAKRISYSEFFNEEATDARGNATNDVIEIMSTDDESEEFLPQSARRTASKHKSSASSTTSTASVRRLTRRQEFLLMSSATTERKQHQQQQRHEAQQNNNKTPAVAAAARLQTIEEERIFLIDFGLASKFMDNGVHRPFVMDQRRAHDGTLEFTSRDAHMGAHSRRSDLECLGYNLIFWSQGYLPWKDAAMQHHQEKVHRAKEYLMTDVREMLKEIYGKHVPAFLGEFLHHVGQLAYHERPDYAHYRRQFENEYQQLGYSLADMRLEGQEIVRTCVRYKEEVENTRDIFEMNKNVVSIMRNLTTVGTPFHERTLSNRVSPKNLRSKSEKKASKQQLQQKKNSWAEILSQDPDHIARERAEKEFDREEELSESQQHTARRYVDKPTYAILEVQRRMRQQGRLVLDVGLKPLSEDEDEEDYEEEEEKQVQKKLEKEEEKKKVALQNLNQEKEQTDDEEGEEDDEEEQSDEDDASSDEADDSDTDVEDAETYECGSDASEECESTPPVICRTRRSAKGATGGRTTEKKTPLSTANNKVDNARKRAATTSKLATEAKSTKKNCTRSSTKKSKTTTKLSTLNRSSGGNSKRGSVASKRATRNADVAASAAGELEHLSGGDRVAASIKPQQKERRTRRCLIKTDDDDDAAAAVVAGGDIVSNSNFSPDVRSLFNVWKKFNNETMYFRGGHAARHCKK